MLPEDLQIDQEGHQAEAAAVLEALAQAPSEDTDRLGFLRNIGDIRVSPSLLAMMVAIACMACHADDGKTPFQRRQEAQQERMAGTKERIKSQASARKERSKAALVRSKQRHRDRSKGRRESLKRARAILQPTDNPYVAYVPTRPQDIAPGLDNPRIAPDIIPLPDDAGDAPGKSPQLDELSPEKRRAITDRIRVLEKALANGSIDFSGLKYKTGYGAGRLLTALDYKSNWPGSMKIGEGEAEVTAFPYKLVRSVCSPSEYYYYLKDTVTSIDDIITLIDKRFLSYVAQDSYGRDPVTAIASGFADCDEFSEIFRDILTYLGEKEGKDYKARVVGQYVKGKKAGHAVAVFEDGGKRFAVDQAKPHEFTQNHEASHLFSAPARGRIITWDESKTDKNRNSLRWTLDDKWEPRKGGTLSFVSYDGEIDFENPGSSNFVASLPGNWKQYKTAAITMRKTGNRVIYKNGELRAFELKTGPIRQIEYQKEDTVLKIYRSGNLEFEHYKAGKLVGKKYRSGPISYEFIKDDKVHERTFRSGEYQRVWYEQNGKVKMYMDFRGNRSFAKH